MIVNEGHVIKVDLGFRRTGYYQVVVATFDVENDVGALRLEGPFFDAACTQRDYNDASTAPKFHPDSFALKSDVKDAT